MCSIADEMHIAPANIMTDEMATISKANGPVIVCISLLITSPPLTEFFFSEDNRGDRMLRKTLAYEAIPSSAKCFLIIS